MIRNREINVMKADLSQFTTTRDGLLAQIAEKEATKRRLNMSIAARQGLIKSLRSGSTCAQSWFPNPQALAPP